MNEVNIKPLSVNGAFKGRRFKTKEYDKFISTMNFILPTITLGSSPYKLDIVFGYSSRSSDIDNGLKCFIDCLVKKYKFDDREIYELNVKKEIVKKGNEFIKFDIKSLK